MKERKLWKKYFEKFILLLLIAYASSCTQKNITEAELWEYVRDPDNGLTKEIKRDSWKITLWYKPTDLIVSQEINPEKSSGKKEQVDALRKKYSKYAYFILNLSHEEIKRPFLQLSPDLKNRLMFQMNAYASLATSNKDTLEVMDYVYPRLFESSSEISMLFAFDKEKLNSSKNFSFLLSEFGLELNQVQFDFLVEDIKETPQINYTNR